VSGISKELLDSWLRGELDEAESAAVEHATVVDPATGALLEQMLADEAANAPPGMADPFRSPEVDPAGPAALAIRGALGQVSASRRRSQMIRVASIAATLLLGLGLWSTFLEPDPQLPGTPMHRVCDAARTGSPLPLYTSVDCGVPPDLHLGPNTGTEVTALRWELDADPRPSDLDWLRARGMVDLLEGRSREVIDRLAGSEILETQPLLHADLATAWLIEGDRGAARQAIENGLRLAPEDATLLANRELLAK
jgi:hypothetical protein